MFKFIERLQKKPKKTRKWIALGLSGGVTLFIFIFWASGIYLGHITSSEEEMERNSDPSSPFEIVGRTVEHLVDDFSSIINEAESAMKGVFPGESAEGRSGGGGSEVTENEGEDDEGSPVRDGVF